MASKFTREQLNTVDPQMMKELYLQLQERSEEEIKLLQENYAQLQEQMKELLRQLKDVSDQLALEKRHRYGRRSEKMEDPNQYRFMEVDGQFVFFNEAEAVADPQVPEPEDLEVKAHKRKKRVSKKQEDLSGLPIVRVDHYLSDEELLEEFGKHGYKQLPDSIMQEYLFVPAKVEVLEHHIGVYSDKVDEHMVKAPHPAKLLHGSCVSPSIAAAIINAKYVNAVPLYRLEQEFERYGLAIPRVNMANWMIRLAEDYFGIIYDRLHELLFTYSVIQADETPCLVNHDGRPAGTKSYMWVYRSGMHASEKQIILYDYHKTRNAMHPRTFLKGYSGICTTDGYQVYQTIEKEREDLIIAGCWVHMRRRFEEALK